MKLLITIFLTIPTLCFSQHPTGVVKKKNPIAFIDSMIGKKCGDGCCRDLPCYALGIKEDFDYYNPSCNSSRVSCKHLKAGDVVVFHNARNKSGDYFVESHVAIVYKVLNDSMIVIAEQNVGDYADGYVEVNCSGAKVKVEKNSKVVLDTMYLTDFWKSEFVEHIKFHRF
jgi:hypothetical protein